MRWSTGCLVWPVAGSVSGFRAMSSSFASPEFQLVALNFMLVAFSIAIPAGANGRMFGSSSDCPAGQAADADRENNRQTDVSNANVPRNVRLLRWLDASMLAHRVRTLDVITAVTSS